MKIGDKFGRLTVVSEKFKPDPEKYPYFVYCSCECGSEVRAFRCAGLKLTKNPTRSCGCLQRESASGLKVVVTLNEVFNRLTIIEDLGNKDKRRMVKALCSCGNITETRYDAIVSGHTKSCGCIQREFATDLKSKHGMCGTPEYSSWQSMIERCRNPNSPGYENYGGRGIDVCDSWKTGVENFYEDMGPRPEDTSLDRIDVNGNYCKENCRWADKTIQTFNKRKREGCTSQYIGVYFDKRKSAWIACLNYYKEVVFSESFTSEVQAAKAYDEACFEYYGVRKNFPET